MKKNWLYKIKEKHNTPSCRGNEEPHPNPPAASPLPRSLVARTKRKSLLQNILRFTNCHVTDTTLFFQNKLPLDNVMGMKAFARTTNILLNERSNRPIYFDILKFSFKQQTSAQGSGIIKYSVCGVYSPEPRAELYCLQLNFKILKFAYYAHKK